MEYETFRNGPDTGKPNTRQQLCCNVILLPQIIHLLAWNRNYVLSVDKSVSAYYVDAEDFILNPLQKN